MAQPTNYSLETHSSDEDSAPNLPHISPGDGSSTDTLGLWLDTHLNDPNISADCNLPHSQAGARNNLDTKNNTDDDGSPLCDPSTSTTTSSKTSASFVTSSLTSRVSLLSLSNKSTVGMVGNTDYATGSFCSSCSIEPTLPGGFWLDGRGCAMCSYENGG